MQVSRLLISTLAAAGIAGVAGLAVAQPSTTTAPGATTTTTPRDNTTVTPPTAGSTSETATQRMDRERMDRERMDRERMNAPAGSSGMTQRSGDSAAGGMSRRDASGNLTARADRN